MGRRRLGAQHRPGPQPTVLRWGGRLAGEDFTGVADRAGELFLGINDTGVDNNYGSFHISVQA